MSGEQEIDAALHTRLDVQRPPAALLSAARGFGTATLHEAAGKLGALPCTIKCMTPGLKVCGPAVTVHSPGGDNLWLHRALYAAQPGDVLVACCSDRYEYGYWGEIMSTAAHSAKLGGLIIDGCVRDFTLLQTIGFPVFARGLCIRGTGKDFAARGWINHPIMLGEVTIRAGDLIAGDADGVVCIPQEQLSRVLAAAAEREKKEADIIAALKRGLSTLDLYGWSRPAK